ncbi:unnamed protein product [Urochloa humidicola]
MEEEWEIGEDEWVDGEIIAPAEEEVSPPSSDQATVAISHPTPPMEEVLEIGEYGWAIGDLEAPGGRESLPPLSDQATNAISLPYPPMEEDWAIGEEERAIGELEAPGERDESPPLPPGVYVDEGYATAAAAEAAATAALIRNKRGRVPASSKAIEDLREVTTPPTDDDCCAICLQDFDSRRDPVETPPPSELRLRAMPCSHTFHEHCIFEWLRRNTACPLCRHQLPLEEEVDEEDQRRRSRRRVFYNEDDGRYYVSLSIREQALAYLEEEEELDPEQQRRREEHEAHLREALADWHAMVASWD